MISSLSRLATRTPISSIQNAVMQPCAKRVFSASQKKVQKVFTHTQEQHLRKIIREEFRKEFHAQNLDKRMFVASFRASVLAITCSFIGYALGDILKEK